MAGAGVHDAMRCIDLSEAKDPETRSVHPVREGFEDAIDEPERA